LSWPVAASSHARPDSAPETPSPAAMRSVPPGPSKQDHAATATRPATATAGAVRAHVMPPSDSRPDPGGIKPFFGQLSAQTAGGGDRESGVHDTETELIRADAATRCGPLDHADDLARGQRRVRLPDLGCRGRYEWRGERGPVDAGRSDGDPRPGVREELPLAGRSDGGDGEPGGAKERRGVLRPARIIVAGGCDDQNTARDRERDRRALDRRCPRPAKAEVDDPRAVHDGVANRRGLTCVAEGTARATGTNDQETCVAARARDERRHLRTVAVEIAYVAPVRAEVVGCRMLCG